MRLSQEELYGYSGLSREILTKAGAQTSDMIRLELKRGATREVVEGLLMPRYHTTKEENNYIVLKLKTGYNVGVRVNT